MDAAAAVDAPDGLPVAPPLHRRRPLLGQVVLRERLQRAHQLAVDDPRGEGIELAGDRGHGRFVEEPQALLDVAVQDEAAGLGHPAHGGSSRIALRADVDGLPGPIPSTLEVAREQPFVIAHHREPGVDRCPVVALQQSFRPLDPPPNGRHERRVEEQVQGDTDRCARCREMITRAQALRVGPFPRVDRHVETTRGVPHLGEQGEVRPAQGRACIRLDEQVERVLPLAPPRGFARLFHESRLGGLTHPRPPEARPIAAIVTAEVPTVTAFVTQYWLTGRKPSQ